MIKPAVCVLGMYRSGTSCLAGSLQRAGLQLERSSNSLQPRDGAA